jgi:hypothetical protein
MRTENLGLVGFLACLALSLLQRTAMYELVHMRHDELIGSMICPWMEHALRLLDVVRITLLWVVSH